MLVNFDPLNIEDEHARSHPWGKTAYDERPGRYCDFINHPELIETELEDFRPHADKQAVQTFYGFLRWINGNQSGLETNDCALRDAVMVNTDALFKYSHKIDGRVEILVRNYADNCNPLCITWLFRMLSLYLQVERPDFLNAIVELRCIPTDYITLPVDQSSGHRIRITFCAYGDSEPDVWRCLDSVFLSVWKATKRLNSALSEGNSIQFP